MAQTQLHLISLTWKNFMSYGNTPTTIDLNNNKQTLVMGTNGSGKSTIIDALSFALYGKPYRSVNLSNLVNTINGKDTMVSCTFMVNNKDTYTLTRTLKPTSLKLEKNGIAIPNPAANVDFQKTIEKEILHMTHTMFLQTTVLGTSSHLPFLKLPLSHRREMIENMFNINVITRMMNRTKETTKDLKNQLQSTQQQREVSYNTLQKLYGQKVRLAKLSSTIETKERELQSLNQKILTIETKTLSQDQRKAIQKEANKKQRNLEKLKQQKSQATPALKKLQSRETALNQDSICIICQQQVPNELKEKLQEEINTTREKIHKATDKIQEQIDELETDLNNLQKSLKEDEKAHINIDKMTIQATMMQQQIDDMKKERKDDTIEMLQRELQETVKKCEKMEKELYDELMVEQGVTEVLADNGAKTMVIKWYLEVLNGLIAEYLDDFEFDIGFRIDEGFNGKITQRYRDTMQYDNLSDGEKARLDIALMLAFRDLSEMIASGVVNVIFLDEIDANFDDKGCQSLKIVLAKMERKGYKTITISHKESLPGTFNNIMEVEKVNDMFSMIK